MKIEQLHSINGEPWHYVSDRLSLSTSVHLILVFGSREQLARLEQFQELKDRYPNAYILSCSTAGEILGSRVFNDTIVATAISFACTSLECASVIVQSAEESRAAGALLVRKLKPKGLKHIFVLSDGLRVNGSQLVAGMSSALPADVRITGGLAGDATQFQTTLVGLDSPPATGLVAAVGFYGEAIRIGYASRGGWDSFGQDRLVTKSRNNVLYELDGRCALDLYKEYLGEKSTELPASALLFPLSVKVPGCDPVVRTILSIDEEAKSMTFAGDVPEGSLARLMKANFDRLVDGAFLAATASVEPLAGSVPDLAILISCVGRKLVLDDRIEEEVETVREVVGNSTAICGFYSYGEISPFTPNASCELHNQTMTITTLREVD